MAQNSPSTSLTLLDQLRAPNADAAWTKFERLYAPLLASWARRHGFHETDAADLAQEVLVKLTKQLPAYERQPGGSFRGWLYRITANTARDLRRNRATRALPTGDGWSASERNPTSPSSKNGTTAAAFCAARWNWSARSSVPKRGTRFAC